MEILDVAHPAKRHNQNSAVFGLFAKRKLAKKTIIMEYGGLVCTENEYLAKLKQFKRFDAQWRIHTLQSYVPTVKEQKDNRLLVDASYYSNECVFVNDATNDDVFGKWADHNVSFFEIIIDDWPHMFLRVFDDIEEGEELLTEYGSTFWREFKSDMATSTSLNEYHEHRSQREKEVKKLSGQKRGIKEIDAFDLMMPQRKKRRLSMVEKVEVGAGHHEDEKRKKMMEEENGCSFNYPTAFVNLIDEGGDNEEVLMKDLLKNERKRNEKLMRLLVDAELKNNQIINDKNRKIKELKLEKYRILENMDALKQKNESFMRNNAKSHRMIKKLTEHIPIIIDKVEMLQKEKENEEERKNEFKEKYLEEKRKKKKYKEKLQKFKVDEEGEVLHNA